MDGGEEIDIKWVESYDHNKVIMEKKVRMDKKFRIPLKQICDGKIFLLKIEWYIKNPVWAGK